MKHATRKLVYTALIAGVYTALTFVLPSLGFGPVQMRISEALTLLPVIFPLGIGGVTLGCAVSNLIGFIIGVNIIGYLDIFFGTAATFLAAITTYQLRNIRFKGIPILAPLPPVLFNALIIGAELTYMISGRFVPEVFVVNALQVGMGQVAACYLLGLPLLMALEKSGARDFLNR